jgi:hypothetical protein
MAKIKLNTKGFRELRTSPKVQADLQRRAERVARAAGPGFQVENPGTKNRARRTVTAGTADAGRASTDPTVLLRALNAGR